MSEDWTEEGLPHGYEGGLPEENPQRKGQETYSAESPQTQGNCATGGGAKARPSGLNGDDPYPHGEEEWGTEISRHEYRDANDNPYLLVVHREYHDDDHNRRKKCPQYHWGVRDGEFVKDWVKGPPEGPKIPYYLPELLAAPADEIVFIPEGEPDAEALCDAGLLSTTSSEGAQKHGWTPELNPYFKGRICVILRDNDDPGKWFARIKRHNLRKVAKQVAMIMDLDGYKDVKDWLKAKFPRWSDTKHDDHKHAREELLRRARFALALDELARTPTEQLDEAKEAFCQQWGVKKQTLNALLKEYHNELKLEKRLFAKGSIQRNGRKRYEVPNSDAEKTGVMALLDEALLTDDLYPPMRDLSDIPYPVELRKREPMGLHLLESEGSNTEENKGHTRLPPPATYALVAHDEHSLPLLIEQHIEFYKVVTDQDGCKEIPVALPKTFVNGYLAYRYSKLPKAGVVLTLPLVLPNGEILSRNGLDVERKIVFQIEPQIVQLLPEGVPTPEAVTEAFKFIVDEWLCDVATGVAGKCVVIALALTILERAFLSDRPTFWITAGKRGGGKTTLLHMISSAIFAVRAAAAAWSEGDEERRKAIFSYLLQGLPFVVWDNIPRGKAISCPTIEKVSTAETYTDRVLGVTRSETVSAQTIWAFTGNNCAPKGDLASRSLNVRLEVNRTDPENRSFTHPDPIKWTLDHRGRILAALYTILLGNPRLRQTDAPQAKTRFKGWYHLVGSAVENAANSYGAGVEGWAEIDFRQLFLEFEAEDEEGDVVGDLLQGLLDLMELKDKSTFCSADIAAVLKDQGGDERIKAFFMPADTDKQPSKKAIKKALSAYVDAPFYAGGDGKGDRVLVLKSKANNKTHHFQVVRLNADGTAPQVRWDF